MLFRKLLFTFFLFFQYVYATEEHPALTRILHQLPDWETDASEVRIEKIETGLTNHNFKVIFPLNTYFIRMGSDSPALLGLDPKREYHCTQEAAALGIAPPVILFNQEDKTMVMPFIPSVPLKKNTETRQRIIAALQRFHLSGKILPTTFCPYQIIHDYHQRAADLRKEKVITIAPDLFAIVDEIREAIPFLRESVPCHLDLFSRNFLDDGSRIWIIDWEYSAMADPLYDLATWVSADSLSFEEIQELLHLYQDSPTSEDGAYFYLMAILADIRWGFWALIQAEVSQIQALYCDYAEQYFHQAIERAAHPYYRESLLLLKNKAAAIQSNEKIRMAESPKRA